MAKSPDEGSAQFILVLTSARPDVGKSESYAKTPALTELAACAPSIAVWNVRFIGKPHTFLGSRICEIWLARRLVDPRDFSERTQMPIEFGDNYTRIGPRHFYSSFKLAD